MIGYYSVIRVCRDGENIQIRVFIPDSDKIRHVEYYRSVSIRGVRYNG